MAIRASSTITLSCVVDVFATTRYYLLQSSTLNRPQKPTTNPPGGAWDDAEPGYTAGSTDTLYFVDLTIFSDGTWAYSMVSVSSAYEAAKAAWNKAQGAETAAQAAQDTVDGLKIGGRNLLLDSARELTVTVAAGKTDASFNAISLSEYGATQITEGAELTASFDYEADLTTTTRGAIYTRLNTTSTVPARVVSDVIAAPQGRASITFTVTAAQAQYSSDFMLRVRITVANEGASFRAWNFKLELGNRATDWTPAPEDVEAAAAEAKSAADNAAASAARALASTEVIVGTQTASTNAWTGSASFAALADGQTILYWLPCAGTSTAATLNLTLSGGGTTGAKNVYINATSRCTTHIAAGNMVQMVYRENVAIGTGTYTGWWISRTLNDNTYDRIRLNNTIKGKTAISASRVIIADSGGYFHLAAGSAFDVTKPILWSGSAINAGSTGTNNYLSYPSCTLRNNTTSTWTATQYQTLYLAGSLVGNSFVVASENWLTTSPEVDTRFRENERPKHHLNRPMAVRSSFSGARTASQSNERKRPFLPPPAATRREEVFSMTEKEKRTILDMRAAGKQYKEISAELGIEVSALKVFVHRQKHDDVRRCAQCKKVLPKGARETQRFCSDKCRNDWWYSHQGELQGKRLTAFVCTVCGKAFTSYKQAKYCSRACFYTSKRS